MLKNKLYEIGDATQGGGEQIPATPEIPAGGSNANGTDMGNATPDPKISGAPKEPTVTFDMPAKQPDAPAPNPVVLNIVDELSKPTEGDLKQTPPTKETLDSLQKEIADDKKESEATQQKTEPEKPALTAADFELNKMFAKSIVNGIDDVNSWGCKIVSEAEQKEIFRASKENKDELSQFMVLVMQKMNGKVPLWLYGIWLAGKTFAPPWLLVVEMKQLRAENKKLKNEALKREAQPDMATVIEMYKKELNDLKEKKATSEIVNEVSVPTPANKESKIEEISKKLDEAEREIFDEKKALKQVEKTIDLTAPFGRDAKGIAIAPYGTHPNGNPKRSKGGRKGSSAA